MVYYGDGSNLTDIEDIGSRDDIALLGFKIASNGSLIRYNLVDQSIDAFEDASGVDASASTNETRNASNYYDGTGTADTFDAFTSTGSDTWTCPAGVTEIEVLTVGAGGGSRSTTSANIYSGGSGAGGIVYDADYTVVPAVVYDLTVGAGGAAETSWEGGQQTNGADSVWNVNAEGSGLAFTAKGGGYGATGGGLAAEAGTAGGSGGGGATNGNGSGSSTQASFSGATSYGNVGGSTGGGGGAGEAGNTAGAGKGGTGVLFSTFVAYGTDSSNVASTGANGGWFGSGGTRGATGTNGAGGGGGGSAGATAVAGLANTGGGAGGQFTGGGQPTRPGAVGGSGVIIINYSLTTYNNMTLVSNAQTAQSAPTKGYLVMTYTDGAGTATVNTDIKAYISRNGSAYTSAVTLVSQGTTGGHTILTANGVDLSGITTGTSMRWKIETLNQAVGKQTRIQAVSLGWS